MMKQAKRINSTRVVLMVSILLGLVLSNQGSVNSATAVQPIVEDNTIRARADIAYGNSTVAVTWSGNRSEGNYGLYVATKSLSATEFNSPTRFANDSNYEYNPPKISMHNGNPVIIWAERNITEVPYRQNIREYDNGTSRVIVSNVCAYFPDPDVVVGNNAVHVVYAAAASTGCTSSTAISTNLYYTKRLLGSNTWSVPIKIADRNDANPSLTNGKINYPRIAVNSSDSVLYVVWEQSVNGRTSVWYTSGYGSSWAGGRVSPIDASIDMVAVYPSITIDGSDAPHFTWTELVPNEGGGISPPAYQNIYHRTFERSTATQINFQRVYVTNNIPTITISDVSSFGSYVCVAWYGYYTGDLDEVRVRCSNDAGKQSWSLTMNMSDSPDWLSFYPSLVIDNYYDMHVSWAEAQISGLDYEPVGLYYNEQTATYDEPMGIYFPISLKASTP